MSKLSEKLLRAIEPGVEACGLEFVHAELLGQSGKGATLRVYIDKPGGVNVDDCARVSEQLSMVLDVTDPIQGNYTLEVSSPGLDRPLVKADDFKRFQGETVKIKTYVSVSGRRNFKGRLVGLNEAAGSQEPHITVEVDSENYDLALSGIETARLVPRV